MNAIKLLKKQHAEADALFAKIEKARGAAKHEFFEQLADALAIHCTIEEQHFYPTVMKASTEGILREAVEEHLAAKRVIADLLETPVADPSFDAKITVLKELIHHHVKEENTDLFPKVSKLLDKEQLEALGDVMQATALSLEGTAPRNHVPEETGAPAPL